MGNTRPFTEAHAIAGLDIVVIFKGEVAGPVRKELIKLFDRHLAAASFEKKRAKSASAVWRRSDSDGDRLEEVHLHDRFVHVVAFEYRGWTNSRDQALERLTPILIKLQNREIEGSAVGLAYVDVFLNEAGDYDPTEVLSKNSPLLPASVFDAGPVWKQVLITRSRGNIKLLSNISIDAKYVSNDGPVSGDSESKGESEERKTHATEIAIKLSCNANARKSSELEWGTDEISSKLDYMHSANKDLMLDLLSKDMAHQIGIKE